MSKNSIADNANDLMPQNMAQELSKRPIKKRSGVFKWSEMQVWEPEARASGGLAMIFHALERIIKKAGRARPQNLHSLLTCLSRPDQ